MKDFDNSPFEVGQKLLHCPGTKVHTVSFVGLGPRLREASTIAETAIVRDRLGNLIIANITDLEPHPTD